MIAVPTSLSVNALLETEVTPPAKVGRRWKGVNHGILLVGLEDALRRKDLRPPVPPVVSTWNGGADLVACLFPGVSRGLRLGLGVQASNSRQGGVRAFLGGVEPHTDTPLVAADLGGYDQKTRRHWTYTADFDLKRVCDEVVSWWLCELPKLHALTADLNAARVDEDRAKVAAATAAEVNLIPWSAAGRVTTAWAAQPDQTGLGLVRAFWQAVKHLAPRRQMTAMLRFPRLVIGTGPSQEVA